MEGGVGSGEEQSAVRHGAVFLGYGVVVDHETERLARASVAALVGDVEAVGGDVEAGVVGAREGLERLFRSLARGVDLVSLLGVLHYRRYVTHLFLRAFERHHAGAHRPVVG